MRINTPSVGFLIFSLEIIEDMVFLVYFNDFNECDSFR